MSTQAWGCGVIARKTVLEASSMTRTPLFLALCLAACATTAEGLPAGQAQAVPGTAVAPNRLSDPAELDRGPPPKPGLETPTAAAEALVLRFDWDSYKSVVVVGTGVGMVKPAWVATFEEGKFVVAYRASAFRDARGRLHIDARNSVDVGPQSQGWSPDSFAIGHKLLWSLDDRASGHSAEMGELIPATTDQALWQRELLRVQALVEGGL